MLRLLLSLSLLMAAPSALSAPHRIFIAGDSTAAE